MNPNKNAHLTRLPDTSAYIIRIVNVSLRRSSAWGVCMRARRRSAKVGENPPPPKRIPYYLASYQGIRISINNSLFSLLLQTHPAL